MSDTTKKSPDKTTDGKGPVFVLLNSSLDFACQTQTQTNDMPDPNRIVEVKSNAGQVEIEIVIGQLHWGSYSIYLWDPQGASPVTIGEGLNTDDVSDVWPLKCPVPGLDGRMLSWETIIGSYTAKPGESYSVKMLIRQQGAIVKNGTRLQTGPLNGQAATMDFVTFRCV